MALERVSIIEGKLPVLLVAPHGYIGDDVNTDIIVDHAAKTMKCYAVINRGWERSDSVDELNDKADCNNFSHMEGVVRDEFLDPILRFRSRILKKHPHMLMYMIHGMSNDIRIKTGESALDMIIGYGAGSPPSYTCDIWRKDLFCYLLMQAGLTVWEGKAGGMMSGWTRNNMNQLFRKHYTEPRLHCLQVEIVRELRNDESIAQLTAEYLCATISDVLQYNAWSKPTGFKIPSY